MIQVRPLFPIHFYIDKMLIHEDGRPLVLETLPFHDMTPVAGGIADADQDRLVLGAGGGQGFFTPGIPIHGIMGVLQ